MRKSAKHLRRNLSRDERERVATARVEAGQDKADILRRAKQYKQEADPERATLREAMQVLKAERIHRGLSLADIQKRTGIEPPNLSRLESEAGANPTIATLIRYAEALDRRLMIVLAEHPQAKSGREG